MSPDARAIIADIQDLILELNVALFDLKQELSLQDDYDVEDFDA